MRLHALYKAVLVFLSLVSLAPALNMGSKPMLCKTVSTEFFHSLSRALDDIYSATCVYNILGPRLIDKSIYDKGYCEPLRAFKDTSLKGFQESINQKCINTPLGVNYIKELAKALNTDLSATLERLMRCDLLKEVALEAMLWKDGTVEQLGTIMNKFCDDQFSTDPLSHKKCYEVFGGQMTSWNDRTDFDFIKVYESIPFCKRFAPSLEFSILQNKIKPSDKIDWSAKCLKCRSTVNEILEGSLNFFSRKLSIAPKTHIGKTSVYASFLASCEADQHTQLDCTGVYTYIKNHLLLIIDAHGNYNCERLKLCKQDPSTQALLSEAGVPSSPLAPSNSALLQTIIERQAKMAAAKRLDTSRGVGSEIKPFKGAGDTVDANRSDFQVDLVTALKRLLWNYFTNVDFCGNFVDTEYLEPCKFTYNHFLQDYLKP